jgi:TRAP-type mannitol/chloroaromatic compound transport system permease large subunit
MGWIGLLLIGAALVLMLVTGWPSYAVLLGLCSAGAVLGLALGSFDAAVLSSLPGRVLGLLEHDLLQALALYALVGALLQHLNLGAQLYGGLQRLLSPLSTRAAPQLAGLLMGTLLAPMNGSVGASVQAMTRAVDTPWAAQGLAQPTRAAGIALAGTLGVVVPPSLVLLLLGDAMMRAHTEGLNLARQLSLPLAADASLRIVNTQDVLQAVLLPGLLVLAGWVLLTVLRAPRTPLPPAAAGTRGELAAALLMPVLIGAMLVAVAAGWVRAVEAAATAALVLLGWGVASRRLTRPVLWRVLDDAMALTGALFALLVAATSFSLLLRAFGTDQLVTSAMLSLQGHPAWAVAAVLGALLASALVLDAFELIFLVIPIVMPPLLAQVADAAWVATLALLVLQAGFLLPPLGYAVVLTRAQLSPRPALGPMVRELLPFVAWAAVVIALVAALPQTTRWWRSTPAELPTAVGNPADVEQMMRDMSAPRRSAP